MATEKQREKSREYERHRKESDIGGHKRRKQQSDSHQRNLSKRKADQAAYRERTKDQRREYRRRLYRENYAHRVAFNCRVRIRKLLNGQKSLASFELLGCSREHLIKHLESQFVEGMSWSNYGGAQDQWVIDHIRPCASFDMRDTEQQKACFHYTNLQPLWWWENEEKADRADWVRGIATLGVAITAKKPICQQLSFPFD